MDITCLERTHHDWSPVELGEPVNLVCSATCSNWAQPLNGDLPEQGHPGHHPERPLELIKSIYWMIKHLPIAKNTRSPDSHEQSHADWVQIEPLRY